MGYRDYIAVVSVTTKEERPIFATHVVFCYSCVFWMWRVALGGIFVREVVLVREQRPGCQARRFWFKNSKTCATAPAPVIMRGPA